MHKYLSLSAIFILSVLLIGWILHSNDRQFPPVKSDLNHKIKLPDFSIHKVTKEKKQAFFDYLRPIVKAENEHILAVRSKLKSLSNTSLSKKERKWVMQLAEYYELDKEGFESPADEGFWEELLKRVDVVPVSMVLAQAANESAWGTSRFAVQGNNLFGQWCYSKGCGIVPGQRAEGARHEVAKFNSPAASIVSYMQNINTHPPYESLRDLRSEQRSKGETIKGSILAEGLSSYSERGSEYVKEIKGMIKSNGLAKFDV